MVEFAFLKNWRWKPALDKHEERWPTGTPFLSLFTKLISAQLIAADKKTDQQKPLPGRPAAYRPRIWRLI
ncbi:hypothetical protein [Peptococcus niger]|uniref:hypothetical protein n=1 Tax=Peptococcus niger TaxID=2741 RepID=UPI000B8738E4|nr:hypothetical protein [Peptococcus niger]